MADPSNSAVVRIATFNVENLGAATASGATLAQRIRMLRPQLVRLRADILCLQEVDSQRRRGAAGRQLQAMEALIDGTPYEGFSRATTVSRSKGAVRDKHNLVVLSRFPLALHRQIHHDLVAPPSHHPATFAPAEGQPCIVEWDRPFLYAQIPIASGRLLHVVNLHLRAPRAAFVPGQKSAAHLWRSMAGWAEGFFLAAVKRAGQALEVRLFVDRILDADGDALVAVCGDFNADTYEIPVRTIRGDEEDAGNPLLAMRTLVPADRNLAVSRRFSVVHHGRPQMLDHILVSRPLLAWLRNVEIHNEALGDELITPHAVRGSPESFHAPVVAEFGFAVGGGEGSR
jgi:endonuclease/exonuclease/phosphatase family metal-dependent hydrolase